MELDCRTGLQIIKKAFHKNKEEKLWDMWIALYPDMIRNPFGGDSPLLEFVAFKKFSEMHLGSNEFKRETSEDILGKVYKIINSCSGA